jgi:hypothetical protein
MGGHIVLGFDAVLSGGNLPVFQKNALLPSYRRGEDTTLLRNVGVLYQTTWRHIDSVSHSVRRGVWAGLR